MIYGDDNGSIVTLLFNSPSKSLFFRVASKNNTSQRPTNNELHLQTVSFSVSPFYKVIVINFYLFFNCYAYMYIMIFYIICSCNGHAICRSSSCFTLDIYHCIKVFISSLY